MTPGALSVAVLLSTLPWPAGVAAHGAEGPGRQQAPAGQIEPALAGDCSVLVSLARARRGDVVQVQIGFGKLPAGTVAADAQPAVDVPTKAPLQQGESLVLLINGSEIARTVAGDSSRRATGAAPRGTCAPPADETFAGTSFEATAYVGWAFDQFAPDSMGGYPPGTTTAKHNRYLLGVDFDYRMFGNDSSPGPRCSARHSTCSPTSCTTLPPTVA